MQPHPTIPPQDLDKQPHNPRREPRPLPRTHPGPPAPPSPPTFPDPTTTATHQPPHKLKKDGQVIGITTVLPFKPNSTRFEEALRGDISFLLGDVKISMEDIEEYKADNHIQLYIAEIGIKPSLNKDLRRKYGAKLISRFMDTVVDLGRRGVIVEKMVAVGATKSGVRLLQHFGFSEAMFPRPDTRLFTIDIKESGAPIIRAYREALNESTKK